MDDDEVLIEFVLEVVKLDEVVDVFEGFCLYG